jgi:hypothetical protein
MRVSKKFAARSIFILTLSFVILSLSRDSLRSQFGDKSASIGVRAKEDGWSSIESAYFTIYYRPDANLKRIFGRINTRSFSVAHKPATDTLSSGLESKLAYRFDTMLCRVREILDMYPPSMHIVVRIFKNRKEVNSEYCRLTHFGDECRSFYIYSYNTIYTSEQDISDSIIAHEMAHALLDHYFSATPPEKVAEILAQNVDLHLDD